MAKFKIRLKLTGLEVEIEGERNDVPLMAASVSQQVSNLLQPAITVANNQPRIANTAVDAERDQNTKSSSKGRQKRAAGTEGQNGSASAGPLDFPHQPEAWGNPQQSWSAIEKIIWLLFVYEQSTGSKEMSVLAIAPTFKKHFKQAGALHPPIVTRELGKAKSSSPSPVGEDTTKNPPTWYLTDAGKGIAAKLVASARGQTPSEPMFPA